MKISDINPFIRYARVHHTNHSNKKDVNICYDCRIFFINGVSGTVLVNGEEYNISNKTAIFLPPGTKYMFDFRRSRDFNVFVFDFDLINDFSDIVPSLGTATEKTFKKEIMPRYEILPELSKPIIRMMPQLETLLKQCTDNFLLKTSYFGETSSALLKLCLLEFIRESQHSAYSLLCEKVLSCVHENYSDHALTNDAIANKFGYHPYHLSRIIKQETGKTLHQYIIYHRLHIAKNFLLTTQYDMEEIAWKCGFGSAAYFVKMFRENTGVTPKKYRQLKLHAEL